MFLDDGNGFLLLLFLLLFWPPNPYPILLTNTSIASEKRWTQISQFDYFQSPLGTRWEDGDWRSFKSRAEALSVHDDALAISSPPPSQRTELMTVLFCTPSQIPTPTHPLVPSSHGPCWKPSLTCLGRGQAPSLHPHHCVHAGASCPPPAPMTVGSSVFVMSLWTPGGADWTWLVSMLPGLAQSLGHGEGSGIIF